MREPDSLEERVEQELAYKWEKWGHEQPFANPRYDVDVYRVTVTVLVPATDASAAMSYVDQRLDIPAEWRTLSADEERLCSRPPEYQPSEEPAEDFPWEEPLD